MAVSNKPLIWLPFAAGGMLAALLVPVLMLVLLLGSLGLLGAGALDHARILAFVAHPLVALALFGVLTLTLWHAAHRFRMTVQDLGVREHGGRRVLAWVSYLLATIGTVALAAALIAL
jgi:fumarate reductase subunit D